MVWKDREHLGFLAILLVMIFSPGQIFAQEAPVSKQFELSAAFRYSIPVGNEEPRLKWSDIYEDGFGGGLEIGYRGIPHLTLHGGAAYDIFKGKNVFLFLPAGRLSGKFSDQKLLSLYIGAKLFLLHTPNPEQSYGANPYIRLDIGATFFEDVELGRIQLGRRSAALGAGVGAGVDILFSTRFILFLEGRYQHFGQPDQAGENFRAIPLSAGLRYLL